jgi:DNA-binding CsgD family transcriptional regulator
MYVMDAETTTCNDDRRYINLADLNEKERRILVMLVLGYSIGDMADDLCISRNYVYLLIRQLRVRFLAKTNTAVVVRALTMGLITADGNFLK